jgi:hypothetical protein
MSISLRSGEGQEQGSHTDRHPIADLAPDQATFIIRYRRCDLDASNHWTGVRDHGASLEERGALCRHPIRRSELVERGHE